MQLPCPKWMLRIEQNCLVHTKDDDQDQRDGDHDFDKREATRCAEAMELGLTLHGRNPGSCFLGGIAD